MKSDLIEISVFLHHKTERAILVSSNGNSDDAVWIPLSQCEVISIKGRIIALRQFALELPEWLATEKGLV